MTPFSPERQTFREVLATLAAKTKTKIPALNGRVEKAVKLALAGDVELHDDGTATVYSSSDPTRRYEITQGTCVCRDYEQAPEHLCQHRLSAGLVRRTYELLAAPVPVDPEILEPFPDNDPEEPHAPLPEAPCSVNCHLTIRGRQVQLTLRDTDEGRLLQRLLVVLAQYPLPQTPAEASSQDRIPAAAGYCLAHGVQMKLNEKHGKQWFSHRLATGDYCKGRKA
jgi:hypothetical protein